MKQLITLIIMLTVIFCCNITATQPKDQAIVFIHGIKSGTYDWKPFVNDYFNGHYNIMRYLDNETITYNISQKKPTSNTWIISYYSKNRFKEAFYGNLTMYTSRLNNILSKISKINNIQSFTLIAHSMGGLIARNYMVLNKKNWKSVHKIVTLGTPHEGVNLSVGIVGQLADLKPNSDFLINLNARWDIYSSQDKQSKWGVIGAYSKFTIFKKHALKKGSAIDYSGPGWVTIKSSIPFNEWKDAAQMLEKIKYNTEHFGFRALVKTHHEGLLYHPITFKSVDWATNK